MFEDLFLDDMCVAFFMLICCMKLTTCGIQANKRVSHHCLAQDFNVPQNLRGLLECGVQENLDWDENITGDQAALIEGLVGYAGSVGTALWNEIEEDRSKVRSSIASLIVWD
jgi:hypothetical protein